MLFSSAKWDITKGHRNTWIYPIPVSEGSGVLWFHNPALTTRPKPQTSCDFHLGLHMITHKSSVILRGLPDLDSVSPTVPLFEGVPKPILTYRSEIIRHCDFIDNIIQIPDTLEFDWDTLNADLEGWQHLTFVPKTARLCWPFSVIPSLQQTSKSFQHPDTLKKTGQLCSYHSA